MAADFAWLMVMFLLRICKSRRKLASKPPVPMAKSHSLRRADEELAGIVSQTREEELIEAAHGGPKKERQSETRGNV